jgi:hypothetical protein
VTSDQVPDDLTAVLPVLCRHYLEHRFDLLGSGWVQVRHGMTATGLEGHCYPAGPAVVADRDGQWLNARVTTPNLPEAQRLWRLVEAPYQPIDWQLDFKSGFRWDGRCYYRDTSFGDVAGADIKVPWELARLQHLPQLATAHILAKAGRPGFDTPYAYAREVRNQILDFLAANPPRFGVNWVCPMDVGIRAANILIAVDLMRGAGATLDAAFEQAVARAAAGHARHILANLEWSTTPRSNHYLSNLAGLLFCALYLPTSDETDSWLDFAAQQLSDEVVAQFMPDGGNFEGSTNYHRLSAELALFSTAALLGVATERSKAFSTAVRHRLSVQPPLGVGVAPSMHATDGGTLPLSEQATARLQGALACVAGWSKPDGRPPQIGDTDSGRLFKLHPILYNENNELKEATLDHRTLLSAKPALFAPASPTLSKEAWFDGVVLRALAQHRQLPALAPPPQMQSIGDDAALATLVARVRALPSDAHRETSFTLPGLVARDLRRQAFADFGLFVFKNDTTFASLRCVADYGNAHTMGHYHDDNLALELHHCGTDLISDPGSYLYTALAAIRDRYRGAAVHFVPRPQDKDAASALAPFAMCFKATARCMYFGPGGIAAVLSGDTWQAFRAVLINDGQITVLDGCAPGVLAESVPVPVSDGYGQTTSRMSLLSLPSAGGRV